jgi:uncharacterized protein GlcG (DUF336 family)
VIERDAKVQLSVTGKGGRTRQVLLPQLVSALLLALRGCDSLITFPGGLPVVDEEGVLIGAIGVSGSAVENDNAVAEAGVKVVGVSNLPAHPWRT